MSAVKARGRGRGGSVKKPQEKPSDAPQSPGKGKGAKGGGKGTAKKAGGGRDAAEKPAAKLPRRVPTAKAFSISSTHDGDSHPDDDIHGWGENERGVSFIFGSDVVKKFCAKHEIDLVCRAHQVVEKGYEFFAERSLVTIFSAPNYCGEFDNSGAMMSVDDTLMCSF